MTRGWSVSPSHIPIAISLRCGKLHEFKNSFPQLMFRCMMHKLTIEVKSPDYKILDTFDMGMYDPENHLRVDRGRKVSWETPTHGGDGRTLDISFRPSTITRVGKSDKPPLRLAVRLFLSPTIPTSSSPARIPVYLLSPLFVLYSKPDPQFQRTICSDTPTPEPHGTLDASECALVAECVRSDVDDSKSSRRQPPSTPALTRPPSPPPALSRRPPTSRPKFSPNTPPDVDAPTNCPPTDAHHLPDSLRSALAAPPPLSTPGGLTSAASSTYTSPTSANTPTPYINLATGPTKRSRVHPLQLAIQEVGVSASAEAPWTGPHRRVVSPRRGPSSYSDYDHDDADDGADDDGDVHESAYDDYSGADGCGASRGDVRGGGGGYMSPTVSVGGEEVCLNFEGSMCHSFAQSPMCYMNVSVGDGGAVAGGGPAQLPTSRAHRPGSGTLRGLTLADSECGYGCVDGTSPPAVDMSSSSSPAVAAAAAAGPANVYGALPIAYPSAHSSCLPCGQELDAVSDAVSSIATPPRPKRRPDLRVRGRSEVPFHHLSGHARDADSNARAAAAGAHPAGQRRVGHGVTSPGPAAMSIPRPHGAAGGTQTASCVAAAAAAAAGASPPGPTIQMGGRILPVETPAQIWAITPCPGTTRNGPVALAGQHLDETRGPVVSPVLHDPYGGFRGGAPGLDASWERMPAYSA